MKKLLIICSFCAIPFLGNTAEEENGGACAAWAAEYVDCVDTYITALDDDAYSTYAFLYTWCINQ